MDAIAALETLVAVIRDGSFVRAARRLGISSSVASAHIELLAGTRGPLLRRTGGRIIPTRAGEHLVARAGPLLDRANNLFEGASVANRRLAGRIRIGAPPAFATAQLAPALAVFLENHPGVTITLVLDDGLGSMAGKGLDVEIRLSSSWKDHDEVTAYLGRQSQSLAASPAYLARHGHPLTIADLKRHCCLLPIGGEVGAKWDFITEGRLESVFVGGVARSNIAEALRAMAVDGLGIIQQPDFLVRPFIADGRLLPVLEHVRPIDSEIRAVYELTPRTIPRRLRALIDHLKTWFNGRPC